MSSPPEQARESAVRSFRRAVASRPGVAAVVVGLGLLCLWAFWPALRDMAHKWATDPQYSHGYLVPLFSVALLVMRRDRLRGVRFGAHGWGLGVVVLGAAAYVAAGLAYVEWAEAAALVLTLAGLFALLGGRPALGWAWPALLFLLFMIPLPFRVEHALSHPLQRAATLGSTFVLQTVGLPALAEGNVIVLESGRIGVVEACSGLSMLLIFFALATAYVIVIRRPLPDKLLLLASAAPIAVLVNVARISATGMAQEWISPEVADKIFHDWAGWLMMPAAVLLLWLETWILGRLLVESPRERPPDPLAPLAGVGGRAPAPKTSPPAGPAKPDPTGGRRGPAAALKGAR